MVEGQMGKGYSRRAACGGNTAARASASKSAQSGGAADLSRKYIFGADSAALHGFALAATGFAIRHLPECRRDFAPTA